MRKIYTVVMFFVMLCGVFTVHSVERCEAVSREILYVDGEFGNYSTIQDAINNASDGDTVFVYNGTYYENIVIDKTINLIGENKDNTTIDGSGLGNVVSISSDLVNISGFTIKNGSIGIYLETYTNDNSVSGNVIAENNNGIFLDYASWNIIVENIIINNDNTGILLQYLSNNNNISGNNITSNYYGIRAYGSESYQCKNNIISANNIVANNQDGIRLNDWSRSNIISKNTISFNTRYGLWMDKECNFNNISGNTIENNGMGIYIWSSYGNIVIGNTILNSDKGIYLDGGSHENHIYHNNFIDNAQNAFDNTLEDNHWDNGYPVGGNYWVDHPYPVDEFSGPNQDINGSDDICDTPYFIPDKDNQDEYPLMEPVTQPPVADANGPYGSLAHLEIEFDGSNSYDPDGYIESYLWDFGDGTNATTVTAVHTYTVVENYTVTLAVTDNRGRTSINSTYALITKDTEPPSKVTGLTVSDAKDGKLSLSWNASSDNVAIDHYIVYRDSTLVINRTTTEYLDTGLKNDQIYIYQVSAVDLSGNEGEKSDTELGKSTASSSPPSHSEPSPAQSNYNRPTADAGGPYYGWIGDEIEFDGTGSHDNDEDDSSIVQYDWKYFKEDIWHNDIGATPTHIYNETGEYTLTLRVHDDEGSTDTNSAMVIISKANSPPTNPIVDGETTGHQNIECSYTATSTDIDNDAIRYTFIWGDGNTTITEFYQNGTTIQQNHMWKAAGIYTISVQADDNETTSGLVLLTVLIDVAYVVDIGHVIDRDGNGIYDSFYSNATGNETIVEQLNNGNYLLDIDGDGNWDHIYNPNNGTLTLYEVADKTGITTEFSWILIIVVTIATVIVIVYSYRNGFFGKDQSKYTAKKSHGPLLKNKERKKFETEWKENEAYRKYGE